MMRIACLVILLGACFEDHPAALQTIRQTDCYTCHQIDYDGTTQPAHLGMFPTTCADCHRTSSWDPALDGPHPDNKFPRVAHHANITCLKCHDLDIPAPSTLGANTDCVQCHPSSSSLESDHRGVVNAAMQPYVYQGDVRNFCLQCHPAGTALHHDDFFSRRHGGQDGTCTNCHIRSLGPDSVNVTCKNAGCHTQPGIDGKHREVGNYNPNNCLQCHRGGRGGD